MKYIDENHAFINWQGKNGKSFQYGIPRYFRKYLVDLGVLSKTSQSALAFRQRLEYNELCHDLIAKGSNPTDFFRQRLLLAIRKENNKLAGRIRTGEI